MGVGDGSVVGVGDGGGTGVGDGGSVGDGTSAIVSSEVGVVPQPNIVPVITKTIAAIKLNLKYRGIWFIRSLPFVILIYLCCSDCYHLVEK